jgi:hypothetical protein
VGGALTDTNDETAMLSIAKIIVLLALAELPFL